VSAIICSSLGDSLQTVRSEINIGDTVRLNSGGPNLTVVGGNQANITIEWRDVAVERRTLPRPCVHKV
jgi:uncharacterized protein YodC (DUF2158 family)